MLQHLSWLIPASASSLAIATLCAFASFWIIERLVTDYRLSKVDGVRASILAGNPITSFFFFFKGAYMHSQNRLLEYYFSMFDSADPSCPSAVEITIIGRRSIVTIDPEHIKAVLATNFTHFGKGERFHSTWEPFLGDSIFTTDGQLWQQSRTLIRPMFLKQKIRDMDIVERWSDVMISKIPPSGQTVDISDLFYRMTLDATTDYLLGHSVESLENPKGEFSKAFTYVQRKQMLLTLLAPLRSFIPKGEYKRGIKILEAFIQPFIEATLALVPEELEKISKSDKEFTFLHQIALFSRDPKVIRDQIMAVLLAGRDTTAATLSWALYELSNYPETWHKLRSHVLQKVGPDAVPTYDDIKDLTYLTHTLYETMRLYPAVPFNIRTCLENSTLPGLPGQPDIATLKGDHIIYSTLAMQRRKELYPPVSETFADPAIFSPERWDHWTPKPWQFVPFNGGPRICIGQNFAMTEMAFMMIRLLQKYERIEYRGDWAAQYLKADIVGCPGQGVPIALYEAEKRY
ncbi:cytochrome P450 52A1 [Trichoderma asperellum]|uniref:Cytochrome P450 52A1 n=1 Tax=Trichoderma asperellum TaxID=101201 RepID=A0A6V8R330_TRIAP|nr:cytochrome P450 52A1 [Trichoderma asperellum]